MSSRPFAEATQAEIDKEVSKLLREAEDRAIKLLQAHRPELDSLVNLLLERETVDGADVYRLAGRPDRSAGLAAPSVVMAPHPATSESGGSGVSTADSYGSSPDSYGPASTP